MKFLKAFFLVSISTIFFASRATSDPISWDKINQLFVQVGFGGQSAFSFRTDLINNPRYLYHSKPETGARWTHEALEGYLFSHEVLYYQISKSLAPPIRRINLEAIKSMPGAVVVNGSDIAVPVFERYVEYSDESLKINYWKDGAKEFVRIDGFYTMENLLIVAPGTNHRFKLIATRNPASDGWIPAEYEGISSSKDDDDLRLVEAFLKSNRQSYTAIVDNARRTALVANEKWLAEQKFGNYRKNGDFLLIEFSSNDLVLVNLMPFRVKSQEEAALYCENLTVNSMENWQLPQQWVIAYLLYGEIFTTWPSSMRIKDTAHRQFWGEFENRLLSLTSGATTTIISAGSSPDPKYRDAKTVYTITMNHAHDPSRTRFFGDSIRVSSRSGYKTFAAFCINNNQTDIAKFKR